MEKFKPFLNQTAIPVSFSWGLFFVFSILYSAAFFGIESSGIPRSIQWALYALVLNSCVQTFRKHVFAMHPESPKCLMKQGDQWILHDQQQKQHVLDFSKASCQTPWLLILPHHPLSSKDLSVSSKRDHRKRLLSFGRAKSWKHRPQRKATAWLILSRDQVPDSLYRTFKFLCQ